MSTTAEAPAVLRSMAPATTSVVEPTGPVGTSTAPEPALASSNGTTVPEPAKSVTASHDEHHLVTAPARASVDKSTASTKASIDPAAEFTGDLDTNNTIPTLEEIRKVQDFPVLDVDGKTRPFKSLYSGPNVARRVLVVFIRHFYCGNCQEYIRALSQSISTNELLQLPVPTFIAIIGCGAPTLIPMWVEATNCPFPVYADPSRKLYQELGMVRTLNLGPRPEYVRQNPLAGAVSSIWQGLKQVGKGQAMKGGDIQQVGGEFLFEPASGVLSTPLASPAIGGVDPPAAAREEEKRVVWCHRMKNTRDHAEVPELREILGLDGVGNPGKNEKRWSKAVLQRKGTGFSAMASAKEDGPAPPVPVVPAIPAMPQANGHSGVL